MTCAHPRCRQPSTVGILPTGLSKARFYCPKHWEMLAATPGSVCKAAREALKKL